MYRKLQCTLYIGFNVQKTRQVGFVGLQDSSFAFNIDLNVYFKITASKEAKWKNAAC